VGITIATSISPHNREIQKNALASWKNLGFSVISVNSAEELDLIKNDFPDVTFIEAARNAGASMGKPFVYFDDILKALESTGAPICGIVNSDIHLITADDFSKFIAEQACESFVFGSRVDVASLSCLEGEEYFLGFDYFFFYRAIIKEYRQTDFCMGIPWWDYWAASVPLLKGYSVKQLISPVAFHIRHPERWDQQSFLAFGTKFVKYLKLEDLYHRMGDDLIAAAETSNGLPTIELLSICIADFINQRSAKIAIYRPVPADPNCNDEYMMSREELAFQKRLHKRTSKLLVDRIQNLQNSGRTIRNFMERLR
jgi:hypothetical protein